MQFAFTYTNYLKILKCTVIAGRNKNKIDN